MNASNTNTHLDIHAWAAKRVAELTNTILSYVSEGIEVEHAIDMVRSETILGEMYFKQVVDNVFGTLRNK